MRCFVCRSVLNFPPIAFLSHIHRISSVHLSWQVLTSWLSSTLPLLLSQRPSLLAAISTLSSSTDAVSAAQSAMPIDHSLRAVRCLYHLSALCSLPRSTLHALFEFHSSASSDAKTEVSALSRSSSLSAFRECFIDRVANMSFEAPVPTTGGTNASSGWFHHAAATLANVKLIWNSAMSADGAIVEVAIFCQASDLLYLILITACV